jgi:hypothetical protein
LVYLNEEQQPNQENFMPFFLARWTPKHKRGSRTYKKKGVDGTASDKPDLLSDL